MHLRNRFLPLACLLLILSIFLPPGKTTSGQAEDPAGPAGEAAALPAALPGLELVGHSGGWTRAVHADDRLVYAGFGNDLVLLEPEGLTRLGSVHLSDWVVAIAAQERADGRLYAYAVAGYTKYMGRLHILDVTDPTHPTEAAWLDFPDQGTAVDVQGDFVYLAAGRSGLRIIDVSVPSHPVEAGAFLGPQVTGGVQVQDGLAYLGTEGLTILDVQNPHRPVQVGFYATRWPGPDVALDRSLPQQKTVFLLDTHAGVRAINVSDPTHPIQSGEFRPEGWTGFQSVAVGNQRAYVLDSDYGLVVLDVTHPNAMQELGRAPEISALGFLTLSRSTLIGANLNGLYALDITDPARIQTRAAFDGPEPMGLKLHGKTAYFFNAVSDEILQTWDVSDPNAPRKTGALPNPGYSIPSRHFVLAWPYAFLPIYNGKDIPNSDEVIVVDVSDPGAPRQVSSITGLEHPQDIAASDNKAYITTRSSLVIYSLADPTAPAMAGQVNGTFYQVAVQGRYAYLSGPDGFQVADVADPATAQIIGQVDVQGEMLRGLDVASGTAAVLNNSCIEPGDCRGGVTLIEVSDPTNPQVASFIPTGPYPEMLRLAGRYLYVLSQNELFLYDTAYPQAPLLIDRFGLYPENTQFIDNFEQVVHFKEVEIENGTAYLSASYYGLYALRYGTTAAGKVVDVLNRPVAGVEIQAGAGLTAPTGPSGSYFVSHLPQGAQVIAPVRAGFTFSPPAYTVDGRTDQTGLDFTLLPLPVSGAAGPDSDLTLTYQDTQGLETSLTFPAGAYTGTVDLVPTVGTRFEALNFAGHAFEVQLPARSSWDLITFTHPVQVDLHYSPADLALVSDEAALVLMARTQTWVPIEDHGNTSWAFQEGWGEAAKTCSPAGQVQRDLDANRLQVEICRPGTYVLAGPGFRNYLPGVWR